MTEKTVLQKEEKGRVWAAAERFTGDAASFVLFIVLARLLFPADYGAISLAAVLTGLGTALVRNVIGPTGAGEREAAERSTAFLLWLALGLLLCGAAWLSAGPLAGVFPLPGLAELLRAMSFLLPLSALQAAEDGFRDRKGLQKRSFLASLFGTAASLALGLLMARRGYGVWAMAAQLLCKAALDALLRGLALRWRPGPRPPAACLPELLRRQGAARWTR